MEETLRRYVCCSSGRTTVTIAMGKHLEEKRVVVIGELLWISAMGETLSGDICCSNGWNTVILAMGETLSGKLYCINKRNTVIMIMGKTCLFKHLHSINVHCFCCPF